MSTKLSLLRWTQVISLAFAVLLGGCGGDVFDATRTEVRLVDPASLAGIGPGDGWSFEGFVVGLTGVDVIPCGADKHLEATPFRVGLSHVWRLDDAELVEDYGTLAPPMGDYCEVLVTVVPLDDDAIGIAESPELVGLALRADITSSPDSADIHAVSSTLRFDRRISLDLPWSIRQPGSITVAVDQELFEARLPAVLPAEGDLERSVATWVRDAITVSYQPSVPEG